MIRTPAVLLALTMTLGGCSSGPSAGGPPTVRRSPNAIAQAELADPSVNMLTIYDAIQQLRPSWFRSPRAVSVSSGSNGPAVMINDSFSSVDQLRGMRATEVSRVEYMSAADATTLYGTGYANGLIKVTTTRGRPR